MTFNVYKPNLGPVSIKAEDIYIRGATVACTKALGVRPIVIAG
jgi:hypothetical protein